MQQADRPLDGLIVADFSQFLSGPYCTLKLADLGATVIKIERPGTGDPCRNLYISDPIGEGENSLFHAINRNKKSVTADLRNDADRARVKKLLAKADVVVQNFRPGVIERQGFGYEDVCKFNPNVVYGSISGFGESGPWKDLPGQDLLAQARSGLLWLTGSENDPPIPMGLAVADMLAGHALCTGILAALVGRGIKGNGALIQTSLFEAMIDFQFEVLSTHLNDGNRLPERSGVSGAHAYLGAPYGVYQTFDGYLALAMTPTLKKLSDLLNLEGLEKYFDDTTAMLEHRDEIKGVFAKHLKTRSTAECLAILQPADVWCSEVLDWPAMFENEAYQLLDLQQVIGGGDRIEIQAIRQPIRVDGMVLKSSNPAPLLGQDNDIYFG